GAVGLDFLDLDAAGGRVREPDAELAAAAAQHRQLAPARLSVDGRRQGETHRRDTGQRHDNAQGFQQFHRKTPFRQDSSRDKTTTFVEKLAKNPSSPEGLRYSRRRSAGLRACLTWPNIRLHVAPPDPRAPTSRTGAKQRRKSSSAPSARR